MVFPVTNGGFFPREHRKLAFQKITEIKASCINIFAIPVNEIHRHVKHVIDILFIAEIGVEHERQHACPMRVGVRPDMASVRQEAVRLALKKRGIGEQCCCQRLQRQRCPELVRHVGFARIIEIDLNRAGPKHHVEAHAAHPRHMAQHNVVPAFGHDGQFGAGLVWPEPEAKKACAGLVPNRLYLLQMASGFSARLVQVFERRTGQF